MKSTFLQFKGPTWRQRRGLKWADSRNLCRSVCLQTFVPSLHLPLFNNSLSSCLSKSPSEAAEITETEERQLISAIPVEQDENEPSQREPPRDEQPPGETSDPLTSWKTGSHCSLGPMASERPTTRPSELIPRYLPYPDFNASLQTHKRTRFLLSLVSPVIVPVQKYIW